MKVVAPEELCVGWVVNRLSRSQLVGSVICKIECCLKAGQAASPSEEPPTLSGDAHCEDSTERSLIYASDFAAVKPRADVVLVGTGYAPGGNPAPFFEVGLKVGELRKTLAVIGHRAWKRGIFSRKPGEGKAILKLPLVYENAWGGKGHKKNPLGRERETEDIHNI